MTAGDERSLQRADVLRLQLSEGKGVRAIARATKLTRKRVPFSAAPRAGHAPAHGPPRETSAHQPRLALSKLPRCAAPSETPKGAKRGVASSRCGRARNIPNLPALVRSLHQAAPLRVTALTTLLEEGCRLRLVLRHSAAGP